jgi:hypothetical protein
MTGGYVSRGRPRLHVEPIGLRSVEVEQRLDQVLQLRGALMPDSMTSRSASPNRDQRSAVPRALTTAGRISGGAPPDFVWRP